MIVQIALPSTVPVSTLLRALEGIVPSDSIRLFEQVPLVPEVTASASPPTPPAIDVRLRDLIVEHLRPFDSGEWRALQMILTPSSGFWETEGESDPALRNKIAGISRRLSPHLSGCAPIDLLTTRTKEREDGLYVGIRYNPTALGRAVYERLLEIRNQGQARTR